jgi:PAS domain-containing protein
VESTYELMSPTDVDDARATGELEFRSALLDAIGQPIVAADMASIIVGWNKAAEETYGWSAPR